MMESVNPKSELLPFPHRREDDVMAIRKKKTVPYPFVLDELDGIYTLVRPMFGGYSVYRDEAILLIFRRKEDHLADNGVWVATTPEHHASLRGEIPCLRRIRLLSETGSETGWQNIPEESPDFEESVLRACALIRKRDPRIGKIPKARKPKRKK